MTPELFQKVEELFHSARERTPVDRAALLADIDPELRCEVEALLAQRGDTLLERPLPSPVITLETTVTRVAPGAQLGPYTVEAVLGAGGMGEVYRARDTRLGRRVAIKVSAHQFSDRFDREARAIAALNHPHICTLYDVGPNYLVMELVEGETLAAQLKKGKFSIEQTIRYCGQISDALAAAHAKGITHRDLKPANIMVTKSGIKVLDFGLAKVEGEALTRSNVVMGTPAYMAPEQREGKQVDARTDVYAFGLVLYEMTTGQRPATQRAPVELAALDRVIGACLAADPDERFQTARDLQRALDWVLESPPVVEKSQSPRPWWIAAAGAATLVALTFGVLQLREKPPADRTLRYTIAAPENTTNIHSFAISPDGREIAIAAEGDGKRQLWLRSLDTLQAQPLRGTEDASYPFWSPDSRYIAFFAQGKLKKIAASGGPPQSLCDAPDGRGGSWNRDDVILFSPNAIAETAIQRVSSAGGIPVDVTTTKLFYRHPVFLPDGRHFLYVVGATSSDRNGVYMGVLNGTENRRLLPIQSSVVFAAGRLLFVSQSTLMAQPFDPTSGRTTGEVVPIAEGVSQTTNVDYAPVSASATGVLVYESGEVAYNNHLVWYDRSGKLLGTLGAAGSVNQPAISPDEKSVVFRDRRGMWLWDVIRGAEQPFATAGNVPFWSPKGDRIVFNSRRGGGVLNLYQKATSGTGKDELLLSNGKNTAPTQWSRDGHFIVYIERDPKTKYDIWVLAMDGAEPKPVPFLRSEFNEVSGQLSPDSHWMAYTSDESGQREVYVRPFPGAEFQRKISIAGGEQPRWRGDGKELFFVGVDDKMMAVDVKAVTGTKPSLESGVPQVLFSAHLAPTPAHDLFQYDVTADGKRFLLDTVGSSPASQPQLNVVVNWDPWSRR